MKPVVINGTNGIDATKAYGLQQQSKANPKTRDAASKLDNSDILEISPEARQARTYQAALKALPEVRDDLVTAVKKGIQNGTYKPDPLKIAEGIIESGIIVRW